MNLSQAIELCVKDRIKKSKGSITPVDVLINTKKKFIQIDGVFYNFGSENESEGIFVNFEEGIEDWEVESIYRSEEIKSIKFIRKKVF